MRIRVLASIYLDDEFLLAANEIAKVRPYRQLSHEFVAVDLPGAQMLPKFRFGIGLADAQMPRETGDVWLRTPHAKCSSPGSFHDPTSPRKRGEVKIARNQAAVFS